MIEISRGDRIEFRQRPDHVEAGADPTARVIAWEVERDEHGRVTGIRTALGRLITVDRIVQVVERQARPRP